MTSSEVEQTPPPPGSHPNFCWEFGAYPVRSWGLGGGRTGRHSREDKVRRPPEGAGPTGGGLSQRVALGGRRRGSDCPRRGAGELGDLATPRNPAVAGTGEGEGGERLGLPCERFSWSGEGLWAPYWNF